MKVALRTHYVSVFRSAALCLSTAFIALCSPALRAQLSPNLARYDSNHDGKLDAAETAAMKADEGRDASASRTKDDVTTLTPFQVDTTKDSGYFAENTLAGSRMNSNLADLAASITVVTKQQMDDTASLNINDVFRYEANTEGSGSYTPTITDRGTVKDAIAGYSLGNDGGTTTNAQSNRVRGLAAPDSAINYFATNSRVPFDSYNTQSVEISRGPNSLLFGLGSPAGIVNQTTAQAVLDHNTNQVQLRTDDNGSFRSSVAFNRSLIRDKLAIYVAMLYDDERFERKPARDLYRRQFGAITYKPFSKTVIRADVEGFLNNANRPNSLTPRDFVTPWLQSGRPAYDPITRSITVGSTGAVTGPYVFNVNSPGYNAAAGANAASLTATTSPYYVGGILFDNVSRPLTRLDNGSIIDSFQRQPVLYAPAQTNPATAVPTGATLGWAVGDPRYAIMDRQWSASTNLPAPTTTVKGQPGTYGTYIFPSVTNKSIYNYSKYNINQTNFGRLKNANYHFEIEQEITTNLFFSAGFFRQDIDSAENYTLNQLTGATLTVDTNTRLIDGRANPYFGKVYVTDSTPDTFYQPETDDNYRALLAYTLDFTKNNGWSRWLGKHRILGLTQERDIKGKVERWRLAYLAGDADGTLRYLPNPTLNNGYNLWNDQAFQRNYYLANPGSPAATVTQSSGNYNNRGFDKPFTQGVSVYNYNTGQFQTDNLTIGDAFADNGSFRRQSEVKSVQVGMQSSFLEDRLITTLGWHRDWFRARRTTTGAIAKVDGTTVAPTLNAVDIFHTGNGQADYDLVMNRWNRWDHLSGDTKTVGGVLRPFKGLGWLGSTDTPLGELFQGLSLYYNKSDNFNPPAAFQTDFYNKPLPKPKGEGRDIGIGFSTFHNKLVARLSWFETSSENERTSQASTLLTRLTYGDTTLMLPWAQSVVRLRHGANPAVSNWNTDTVNPLTSTDLTNEVWGLLKLPVNYYNTVNSVGGTQDSKAKGLELQLTYNPTTTWTIKLTGGKQETSYKNVAPQFDVWESVRLPVWLAARADDIPDFVDGAGTAYSLKSFWDSYGYSSAARLSNTDGNTSARNYYANTVTSQIGLAKALEGVAAPDQRKYRGSILTNYMIPRGRFQGVSFGGNERYESKAALGYFGKVGDPTRPTVLTVADPTRPVYDDGNFYTDLWLAYQFKVFHNKVGVKIQLNCENATEDGRLQAIAVNYDGLPYAYRIVDPRRFLLTSTFTF